SVIDPSAVGGMEGLSLMAGASTGGREVWVRNPTAAQYARQLLADHAHELRSSREQRTGLIQVDCEECGALVKFPADKAGTRAGTGQECPSGGASPDGPDPADEWHDEDTAGGGPEADP